MAHCWLLQERSAVSRGWRLRRAEIFCRPRGAPRAAHSARSSHQARMIAPRAAKAPLKTSQQPRLTSAWEDLGVVAELGHEDLVLGAGRSLGNRSGQRRRRRGEESEGGRLRLRGRRNWGGRNRHRRDRLAARFPRDLAVALGQVFLHQCALALELGEPVRHAREDWHSTSARKSARVRRGILNPPVAARHPVEAPAPAQMPWCLRMQATISTGDDRVSMVRASSGGSSASNWLRTISAFMKCPSRLATR